MSEATSGLTFWEHFAEFRLRILRCLIYLLIGTCLGFFLSRKALTVIVKPLARAEFHRKEIPLRIHVDSQGRMSLQDPVLLKGEEDLSRFQLEFQFDRDGRIFRFGPDYRSHFYYFSPLDPFLLWLKASFILGMIGALPFILWEVLSFVGPGLNQRERKMVKPVMAAGLFLFPLGVLFAYYILQFALGFFTRYSFPGLEPRLGIDRYLGFALTLMLAAGIVFELPVAIVILSWMRLVSSSFLRKYRKHAIIVLFVLAAMVTPPDVFTMFAIGLPLILLYEISVLAAVFIEKARGKETLNGGTG